MRVKKLKISAAAAAIAIVSSMAAGCYSETGDWEDTLPAAATEASMPTVSYMTEETSESTEPVTFDTTVSTKRTAYSETTPELATTTETESTEEEASETTVPDAPKVPLSEFTSTTPLNLAEAARTTASSSESSVTTTPAPSDSSSVKYTTRNTLTDELEMPPTTEGVLTTVSAPKVNTAERPYSYKALTEKQLYIYNILIDGLQQHKDSVSFEPSMNITADDYCGVYQIIYDDEPAMFYIDTKMQYTVNSKTKVISGAYLFYKYSENETEKMQKAIDTEADKILAKITSTMTEYDKVKLFHDSLASSVVYDDTANNCRDIYGVFVDKKAICGGYSKAFSYLCTKAGIESLTVTGDADGQPHMWNKVKIDGKWYNIDVTYAVSSEVMGNFVRYDYFCVTDKMLEASRTIYEQPYEYPKATADDCDYYVKNDLVADSWEEVRAILLDSIIEAAKTKASPVQVKCATKELYNEAIKNLFSQSEKQALKIYDEAYDAAENKYDCDMVTYNQDSTSLVIKLFLEYDE